MEVESPVYKENASSIENNTQSTISQSIPEPTRLTEETIVSVDDPYAVIPNSDILTGELLEKAASFNQRKENHSYAFRNCK